MDFKARWRKIGPLIGPSGSRFQRMRLIQQKAWTHSASTVQPTTTTHASPTQRPSWMSSKNIHQIKHSGTPTQVKIRSKPISQTLTDLVIGKQTRGREINSDINYNCCTNGLKVHTTNSRNRVECSDK